MTKTKAAANQGNPKKMQWRTIKGEATLFLTTDSGDYVNYTAHPLCQPDYLASNIKLSKGYNTMQVALGQGYEYDQDVPTEETLEPKTAAQETADNLVNTIPATTEPT
jgi:hypothetical protein